MDIVTTYKAWMKRCTKTRLVLKFAHEADETSPKVICVSLASVEKGTSEELPRELPSSDSIVVTAEAYIS